MCRCILPLLPVIRNNPVLQPVYSEFRVLRTEQLLPSIVTSFSGDKTQQRTRFGLGEGDLLSRQLHGISGCLIPGVSLLTSRFTAKLRSKTTLERKAREKQTTRKDVLNLNGSVSGVLCTQRVKQPQVSIKVLRTRNMS